MSDTHDADGERILTPSFVALLLAQACFGYAFSSFFLLPKFMVTELGAGPTEIGGVWACHGLAVVFCMPVVGGIVDRRGRRAFLTAGAAVMAVATFAFVTVDSVGPWLYLLRLLQGVAFSMAFVGGGTLAVDHAPPARLAQAIGLFGLTFLSMNAIAPAAVEEIAQRAGWQVGFALAGASATLSALLSLRLRDRPDAAANGVRIPGVVEFATRPRQLQISLVIALAGAALGALFTFHQPYALELGIHELKGFFVAYAIAAVTVRVGFGNLVDRIGRRHVSLACLVGYVFIVAGMTRLRPGWLPVFGGAMGITHGLFYPAFNAVAAEGVGAGERGKMMATFQASWQVGFSVGQLALGMLAERAGYPAVFWTGSACSAAALVALARFPVGRTERQPAGGPPS